MPRKDKDTDHWGRKVYEKGDWKRETVYVPSERAKESEWERERERESERERVRERA